VDGSAMNIINGYYSGSEVILFDFIYTRGRGQTRMNRTQTIIMLENKLPPFLLLPNNLTQKISSGDVLKEITIYENDKFSEQYIIKCRDTESIRGLFSDRATEYFASNKGLSIESNSDYFIFYRDSKKVPQDDVSAFIQQGIDIYNLLSIDGNS
jgi:hypothetical protein